MIILFRKFISALSGRERYAQKKIQVIPYSEGRVIVLREDGPSRIEEIETRSEGD